MLSLNFYTISLSLQAWSKKYLWVSLKFKDITAMVTEIDRCCQKKTSEIEKKVEKAVSFYNSELQKKHN